MAVKDVLKVSRKTFFNPSGWIGYDFIRFQHRYIWDTIKGLFTVQKPEREETFEQAMQRLKLTESDVTFLMGRYRTFALLFVICSLLSFLNAFFILFYYGKIMGWLLGMAVTGLFASQAFRYDFWSFQLRSRRLGVTFKEWQESILGK